MPLLTIHNGPPTPSVRVDLAVDDDGDVKIIYNGVPVAYVDSSDGRIRSFFVANYDARTQLAANGVAFSSPGTVKVG